MVIMADIGCMHRSSLDCREGPHPLWLLPAPKEASALSGLSLDVWREFSRPRRPARRRPTDANVVPRVAKRCDLRLLFTNGTACSFRVFFFPRPSAAFSPRGYPRLLVTEHTWSAEEILKLFSLLWYIPKLSGPFSNNPEPKPLERGPPRAEKGMLSKGLGAPCASVPCQEESGWLAVPLTRAEAEAAGPHRPSRGPRPSWTGLKEGKFQEWLTR